ncbi:hypothetical protein E4U55_006929 [Claviceps digitariae]|nr:hypothetical protein E4U55_006929 [Claviceps digitariae]
MMVPLATLLLASASAVSAATLGKRGQAVSVTPHEQYSSSIGALGCKLDTNRVAYWPGTVDCNNICVKLSRQGRSVHLLKIDSSGGAHDISYDAWNYLAFGKSAQEEPHEGGGIDMNYEFVHADECKHLLHDGKLAISAATGLSGPVLNCIVQGNNWIANNYVALNIEDAACHYGHDEVCTLDLAVSNQAKCPHMLGIQDKLDRKVMNVQFGTGKQVLA